LLIVVVTVTTACWKRNDDKKGVTYTNNELKPIPQNGILAQWQNPKVIVYQYTNDSTDKNTYMRVFNELGGAYDTLIFNDEQIKIDSVKIDTITFSNGKYPEIVLTWYANGHHDYGKEQGSWTIELRGMDIWDLNSFTNIFSTATYEHSIEVTRKHPSDSLIDFEKDLQTEESTETGTITIDTLQKIITLDFEYSYHDSGTWSQEVYRYKNGTFVSDEEEEEDAEAVEFPLP
jgi:hypothetical protein